ncbi:signal peptidase II [Candidatus Symbiobacter mobilis CR]|uniref:Lipoprotein signal peptidase n=2 Tax=Candidatus Symbiobacter TaxID=1436289 RepID=U5N5X2_9BURK|nr:signal peptidase II [Candidatus Symbiobacter mobilis]AGX86680.1 signal peptidase II [Candidatus Symbiobacter mobilis CR]
MAWLSVSALIILADQFTKVLIVGFFQVGEAHPVTGFFRLIRVHNAGAAFSMLADASGWQRWFFIGFGVAAALFVVWMLRTHGAQKLFAFALACVLGGAVGNVIDRIVYGHVIDFLDFHWAGVHFPAFNVADSAITVGAALLLLDEFLRVRRQR